MSRRRICFVTGSRAEFGLIGRTLSAIAAHPELELQVVVTGMHLDRRRGASLRRMRKEGWKVDHVVPWRASDTPLDRAVATGNAMSGLARVFEKLRADVVLIVGDRVEAFAAASAAHLSDRAVAHIHGGDRAPGQSDDSMRHAISKLAHLHFAATQASAARLIRMGEDRWRVHAVGAPGIESIANEAASPKEVAGLIDRPFALLALHPTDPDPAFEARRARLLLRAVLSRIGRVAIVSPNNDPGSQGIAAEWRSVRDHRVSLLPDLPRSSFLGLLRDAEFLAGNSSAGIIEAGAFATPVIDIGPRQSGRERGSNVRHVGWSIPAIDRAISRAFAARSKPRPINHPYSGKGTARRIAQVLASLQLDARLLRKRIAY